MQPTHISAQTSEVAEDYFERGGFFANGQL